MEENKISIKGIYSQGYGITSRLVMRDKEISCEAKAIYAYITAFAGAGTTAFPSTSIMLAEIGLSKPRFYKHRKMLVDKGYISIHSTRSDGRQGTNIYEIIMFPGECNKGDSVNKTLERMKCVKNEKKVNKKSGNSKKKNYEYKVIYQNIQEHKKRLTPIFLNLTGRESTKAETECLWRLVNRLNVQADNDDEAYKLLEKALDIALQKNMLRMSYVTGICNNFIGNGFKNLHDYNMDEMKRRLQKHIDGS